jgi:hypothetical protein
MEWMDVCKLVFSYQYLSIQESIAPLSPNALVHYAIHILCSISPIRIHLSFSVDFYLTILGLIQFSGLVLALVPGFLLDWSPAGRHRNFSIIISFVLTGLISILVTVGLLIPVLELQVKFNYIILSIRILATAKANNYRVSKKRYGNSTGCRAS